MHLWRNAALIASTIGLAFALSSCDGDKDDTNGGGDDGDADTDTDTDSDTDADTDTDTDADTDLPKDCTPENVCQFTGQTVKCEMPKPLNGKKECVTWYKNPENCPNPDKVGDADGLMDEVLGCECACMPKDGPDAAPSDPCECMTTCLTTFCPPPK